MTFRIEGEDLKTDTENRLLRRAMHMLGMLYPEIDAREMLCDITTLTNAQIGKALTLEKTSIGGRAWLRLEKKLKVPLYHLWLDAQEEK